LLGVCLGHQAIGAAFGGQIVRARDLMHGKTSPIEHDGKTIFAGLPSPMTATRYHSLIVEEESLPKDLEISAWTTDKNDKNDKNKSNNDKDGTRVIMGLRHKTLPIEGVQFHPESVLTGEGKKLVANFLKLSA
jgi:anthranilate synthase/aminodeoxychorismate synthase-like glutamine amidotransferase